MLFIWFASNRRIPQLRPLPLEFFETRLDVPKRTQNFIVILNLLHCQWMRTLL